MYEVEGGDFLGLDGLLVPQVEVEESSSPKGAFVGDRAGWIEGKFIRSRIPLSWLTPACALPGKALATGLALWYLSGLRKGRKDGLRLTTKVLERFHVDRSAKCRALKALEKAGLVRVERKARKNPVVTIVDQ